MEQALPLLDEAQKRFEAVERDTTGGGAEKMASVCITERGDCPRVGPARRSGCHLQKTGPRNSVTTGASPSENSSLGPSGWSNAASRRR